MKKANQNEFITSAKFDLAAFKSLLNITPDIVFIKDKDLRYTNVSDSFIAYTGKKSKDEIIGKTDKEIYSNSKLASKYRVQDLEMLVSGKSEVNFVTLLPDSDGHSRYAFAKKQLLLDEDGNPIGIFGLIRETAKEYLDKQSYEQELDFLLDTNKNTYCLELIDVDNWQIVRERRRTVDGYKFPLFKEIEVFCYVATEGVSDIESDAFSFYKNFSKQYIEDVFKNGRRDIVMEYRRILPNGKVRWVQDIIKFLVNPENDHLSLALISRDIDERKREEQELHKAAEIDAMTGLLNRASITKKITTFLGTEGADNSHHLFMIDIDNFKKLNDTNGHQKGDKLLINIAQTIKSCFRNTDLVGRVGGDEFFVFMKHCPHRNITEKKALALMEAVDEICSPYKDLGVCISIGISNYPTDGIILSELYKKADDALYYAKQHGKHSFAFAEDIK